MQNDIPKTAIIGSSGFLGRAFLSVHRKVYHDCVCTAKATTDKNDNIFLFDLLNPDIKSLHLSKTGHKEAFIFAAVTKIDVCENKKAITKKINVDGIIELARQLSEEGIKPIFFSSDYVFDGKEGSYRDDSPVNPITEYGKQKAEVEAKMATITKGNFLVVRLSKIFTLTKNDNTLLDEMARILSSGEVVQAAYDQIFCPTLITDIINALAWLQVQKVTGIVNVCSLEVWSRYDLAVSLAKTMKVDANKVRKASLSEIMINKELPKNTSMMPSALLKDSVPFTPMTTCVKRVASNWVKISA